MKIKLLKPHEHAGRRYEPDDVLVIPDDAAEWLIARGVAEKLKQSKEKDNV